jgi:predicted nucleotidyltransferase component of viral defense system
LTIKSRKRVPLEDIIAEKLRALLQQPIRHRNRWQDVFDIARIVLHPEAQLDIDKVSTFFVRKCQHRDIQPHKSSFDENVRGLAEVDYDKRLRIQAPDNYIPFDDAWNAVLGMVRRLDF